MTVKETLAQISQNENFHGVIATTGQNTICNIDSFSADTPFKTHSVGKIFSGVLMIEMLNQGIIKEEDLEKKGIELPSDITKKLENRPAVLERLLQVSILQAMTHEANLGDCLDNHLQHTYEGKKPAKSMYELIDFVSDNFAGKEKYSNDGLLFGGIALQHLYSKATGENLSYEQLLHKLVIEPSNTNISMTKPPSAYHDENMAEFPANPAGGHYASINDFKAFGAYLVEKCQDPKFMELIKKYGSEFYKEGKNMIAHLGDFEGKTPEDHGSSTGFGVFLDSGKTIVVFSNIDASKQDRDDAARDPENAKITECYGHTFFKKVRDAVMEEAKSPELLETEQKWTEKFPKKTADTEDLTEQKKSWREILDKTNRSKDDSTIGR